MTEYLQSLLDVVAQHPALAIALAFVIAAGEALMIVGLFVPSTIVLVGLGGLVGLGHLPFWPIFAATALGAAVGDQVSYWVGHVFKARLVEMWPFTRYRVLLAAGQRYFELHGGKSVVIGRFIPGIKAVVPGIAGMMGLGAVRFTVLNVLSSLAWAAAHLLPGLSAGLALAGVSAISKRLAVALGIAALGIVLAIWLAQMAIRFGVRILPRLQMALVVWAARRHDRAGDILTRLLSPDHADFRVLVGLYAILLGAIIGFASLLEDIVTQDPTIQMDRAFSLFLQTLRTGWFDSVMVTVTLLGDWIVTSAVAAIGCLVLLAYRQVRLALAVAIALASSMLFVQGMKLIVHAPRPIDIYSGADAFSFPSGHATVAATLYGALGFIAFRGSGQHLGRIAVAVCAGLIALIAFSRLYLAAHWPSDVAAGLLFGAGVTAGIALVFQSTAIPKRMAAALLGACAAGFVIVGSWHVERNFERTLTVYAPQSVPAIALSAPWRDGGWRDVPADRIDLAGEPEDPLLLQWRGSPATLRAELLKEGWTEPPRWSLSALNAFALPDSNPAALPAIPRFHEGHRPAVTLVRPADAAGKAGRYVLRAWTLQVREPGGPPEDMLVGTIAFERVRHPLRQATIPLNARALACNGDALLAALPGASLVGPPRGKGDKSCGGRTVLAASS